MSSRFSSNNYHAGNEVNNGRYCLRCRKDLYHTYPLTKHTYCNRCGSVDGYNQITHRWCYCRRDKKITKLLLYSLWKMDHRLCEKHNQYWNNVPKLPWMKLVKNV